MYGKSVHTMNRKAVEKRNIKIEDATLRSQSQDNGADEQSDQATAGDVSSCQSDQATAGGRQPLRRKYRPYRPTQYKTSEEELEQAFRECLKRIGVSSDDDSDLDKASRECVKKMGVSSDDDESKSSKSTGTSPHARAVTADEAGVDYGGEILGISAGETGEGLGLLSKGMRKIVAEAEADDYDSPKQKRDIQYNKKTKDEAATIAATPSPLPSELVATILEMSATPIHTIMQMGTSSKLVVREVLPKLRHLFILRSKDLDVQTAIKLLSPSKLLGMDICCLISLANSSSISSQKYNVGASHKIPFFLSQFPNLKRVYLGGTRRLPVLSMYEPFRCVLPEDHREFHNGLLWALCGAFRSRALSQNLIIDGLVYSGIYCLWSQDRRGNDDEGDNARTSCTFCDAVLDHFPVPMIIRHTVRSRGDSSLCFDERQIYERLMKRSEDLVWKSLLDDTFEVLRHERPAVVSITPSSATRIVNLCSWDLRPNCSKPYWNEILGRFTCISRTFYMVLSYVDSTVEEKRFEIFEDNPRPQLRELLTTNIGDRRSIEE